MGNPNFPTFITVLDLFSGIGGFSLGLERAGPFRTTQFCEIDPFCRRVLARHWPGVPIHDDVRTLHGALGQFDVLCGGFPCQDISVANPGGRGLDGARSGLWWEFHRVIAEVRPSWVVIENSPNLRRRGLGRLLRSLDEIGYDAEWHCIPAGAVGAPHRRDRVWVVAYPHRDNGQRRTSDVQVGRLRFEGEAALAGHARGTQWPPEPDVCRVADGVPARVDRLRALGNAVVPQVVQLIGHAIYAHEIFN